MHVFQIINIEYLFNKISLIGDEGRTDNETRIMDSFQKKGRTRKKSFEIHACINQLE